MKNRQLGMTMAEVMIVLSVVAVIAAVLVPTVRLTRQHVSELLPCEHQLTEIGTAIKKYQVDHQGHLPWSLGRLVIDGYLPNKQLLICPVLRSRLPKLVKVKQSAAARRQPPWSSYFLFSPQQLDRMKARGKISYGYTEVLKRRGGDTPLAICHEHRDHVGFRRSGPGQPDEQVVYWDFPEEPLLILRFNGRVSRQSKPGSRAHADTLFGSQQLLVEF